MSEPSPAVRPDRPWWIPAAILLLAGAFPPETRAEAAVGCLVLCLLAASLAWVRRLDGTCALTLAVVAVAAAGTAPVASSRPLAAVFWAQVAVALAMGWTLFCVPREQRRGNWLVAVLAATGSIAGAHALYQKLWGLERLASAIRAGAVVPDAELVLVRAEVGRAFASFSTPAALGGYLVLTLAVTLASMRLARGWPRGLLVAAAVLQLAGLACTESVTAVLAGLGALGLAWVGGKLPRRAAAAAIGAAMVLAAAVFAVRGAEVLDVGGEDTPWSLRAKNARVALEMAADHPLAGVGAGSFGERYPAYRRPGDNESRHVHNLPLELVAELGIPAGTLGAALFFFVFCAPLLRRSAETDPLAAGAEIGLAAFALQNLADFTAYLPSLLWTAALLRAAVARRDPLVRTWPSRVPAAVALLLAFGASWIVGADAWSREQLRRSRTAAVGGDWTEAERRVRRACELVPWNGELWIARAQLELRERGPARLAAAHDALDRALRLLPDRAAAHDLRGRVRFARGDDAGGHLDALEAVRLYPMHEPYRARVEETQELLERRGSPP